MITNLNRISSWIEIPSNSDFTLQNLPYGIFRKKGCSPVAVTRIGDTLINLHELAKAGLFADLCVPPDVFNRNTLNDFIALGKITWTKLRIKLIELFEQGSPFQSDVEKRKEVLFYNQNEGDLLLPVQITDYTDFYSSIEHATNVGIMFRDPANALLPNWKHLPVGYHGRASSIVVSGTNIHRPKGQIKPAGDLPPICAPTRELDFELEMGFVVGKSTELGQSVSTEQAMDHIFGMLIFNDLSARDIQRWEYVPLGPFLSKNFGSLVSPWIVTMDALAPFATEGPLQDPEVLPYLKFRGNHNYDIQLEVFLTPEHSEPNLISRSNYKFMYWNMVQQLAHHTVNGCNITVGDLYASGTISGPTPNSFGSMLELCWKGTKPIQLNDGSDRTFIQDYDTICMKAYCGEGLHRVGFGEVITTILPAKE
jgi:fumarylacetoacetase